MISLQSYRAVIFDLDGTLRHSQPTFNQKFLEVATSLGLNPSSQGRLRSQRWLHYYWAQSAELLADRESFKDLPDLFWTSHARKKLLAYGCIPEQAEELAPVIYQRMSAEYQPQEWVPPDVIDTLRAMSEAGLRLAVVSNRNQPCKDELARLGLLEYLEFSLTSGEVSSWKPDPTIFKFALQRMELQPQAAVYVGDNYYADVVGANRAGLQPILIDPDSLFPEAECPVISTIGDLCGFLA